MRSHPLTGHGDSSAAAAGIASLLNSIAITLALPACCYFLSLLVNGSCAGFEIPSAIYYIAGANMRKQVQP